jgi:hypothetical protein
MSGLQDGISCMCPLDRNHFFIGNIKESCKQVMRRHKGASGIDQMLMEEFVEWYSHMQRHYSANFTTVLTNRQE